MGKCIERVRAQQQLASVNRWYTWRAEMQAEAAKARLETIDTFMKSACVITYPPEDPKFGWWRALLGWRL